MKNGQLTTDNRPTEIVGFALSVVGLKF